MSKPVLHIIAPFHTVLNAANSHCAFSGKALRFSAMMQQAGYRCIEYSNGHSESACENKIMMLSAESLPPPGVFKGDTAIIGSSHWRNFNQRLRDALHQNLQPGDIVCHTFGRSHVELVRDFTNVYHVETGVGYPDAEFGCHARIFESYAWMHWHAGRANKRGDDYHFVIPNYYDLNDWKMFLQEGQYLLYFGRICEEKGMCVLRELAERGIKIKCVGQGDPTPWLHENLEFLPPVTGLARSTLLGQAKAVLMPTRYIEPFGGAGVEGMLCGTPLIASDHSAFSETIRHGVTGYRCRTLKDWVGAISVVDRLSRLQVAHTARSEYSLQACAPLYSAAFSQVTDLGRDGWSTL